MRHYVSSFEQIANGLLMQFDAQCWAISDDYEKIICVRAKLFWGP